MLGFVPQPNLRPLKGIQVSKKKSPKQSSPGQLPLPWDLYQVSENPDVKAVAEKFVNANGYSTSFR